MKKDKGTNNDLQNFTHKTKDRVTRTPIKTGRVSSSCSTSGTRRSFVFVFWTFLNNTFINSLTHVSLMINSQCIIRYFVCVIIDGFWGLWFLTPLSTIFHYIVAVTFIGGGNRSTRRKPPTCRKSLTNFIT